MRQSHKGCCEETSCLITLSQKEEVCSHPSAFLLPCFSLLTGFLFRTPYFSTTCTAWCRALLPDALATHQNAQTVTFPGAEERGEYEHP